MIWPRLAQPNFQTGEGPSGVASRPVACYDHRVEEIPHANVLGRVDARVEISTLEDFLTNVASDVGLRTTLSRLLRS